MVIYVNYIGRVMERYHRENKVIPKIGMIVIYTGDVEYAKDVYDMGCMTAKLDQLSLIIGIGKSAIENNIAYLREYGFIERIGSKKNGYWQVWRNE